MDTSIIIPCPKCKNPLDVLIEPHDVCANCQWSGEVHLFVPLPPPEHAAMQALPDDAVCTLHPTKAAVAVCSGSGDYVCALCSVELEGQVYSAQYLESGGREKLTSAFDRALPRPDRMAVVCMGFSFFLWFISPVLLPMGIYYCFRMFKLRKTNPLYRDTVSRGRTIWVSIVIGGLIFLYAAIGGAMLMAIFGKEMR